MQSGSSIRAFVTEVEVKFIALGPSLTRVELEHRDLERFGEAAEHIRSRIGADGGWTRSCRALPRPPTPRPQKGLDGEDQR